MVEFVESQHIYLKDGIIIPSVTQIIHKIMPNKYQGIPQEILTRKAEFGTKGHKIIEILGNKANDLEYARDYINDLADDDAINMDMWYRLESYLDLVKDKKIIPLEQEKLVSYKYEYAGTLDMIADINGIKSLCDVKFTYKLDKEYLSWQLGMYQLACNETFNKCYCIWLPKQDKAKLVEITPKTKEEILKELKKIR
jgi:hypothetical protein